MIGSPNAANAFFPHRHLLGIEALSAAEIERLLDLANSYADLPKDDERARKVLRGRTVINLFFETSTRTRTSFELAGKRLGADVINMSVGTSAIKKGETLIDTAMTLNAMQPDVLVVRHPESGAVNLLSQKVDCSVINARRRAARASDPGAARRAHHPPPPGQAERPAGRHLRRHPAQPGGALEHPPADQDGRAGARDRAADPAAQQRSTAWGSRSSPT